LFAKGTILFYAVVVCSLLAALGASFSDGH
jgi:hypothetical protein